MKNIDVIYMKQVLTLTRFWGDNRLCLWAKIRVKLIYLKWNLSGASFDEWCIFIDNLTDDEKAQITDIYGNSIDLYETLKEIDEK